MSTTARGTSLAHVAGDLECFDGERVAVLTSLRPGIDGHTPPALRFFAVMSDGGEDRGDRGWQEDRDDQGDRGAPGKLSERCPGKPKPKRVSLKPAPSLVTLRPASQASRAPENLWRNHRKMKKLEARGEWSWQTREVFLRMKFQDQRELSRHVKISLQEVLDQKCWNLNINKVNYMVKYDNLEMLKRMRSRNKKDPN